MTALRPLAPPLLIAAGVTLVAWLVYGLVVGAIAAARQPGVLDVAIALLAPLPAALGAYLGARRAVPLVGRRGGSAAILGAVGAAAPVLVLGGAGALTGGSSPWTGLLLPSLGAAVGAWLGGRR